MEPTENEIFNTETDFAKQNSDEPSQCGICGDNHFVKECNVLEVTNQISDRIIPSKARLSLPESLEIRKLCDGTYNVYSQSTIKRGTQFGPFQAKKLFTLHPSIEFPLKIFTNGEEDLPEYFLDTSDENECNWMIFVSPASDVQEQNTICYQDGEHLYYSTIKDVYPGDPLKVWYSPHYAVRMKKALLNTTIAEDDYMEKRTIDIEALLKKKKNVTPRESWSCKFCGKVEKELSVFALHLLDHYRAQACRVCAICKDSFQTRAMLQKHLKMVHGNNLTQSKEVIKETEVSTAKVKELDSKDTVGGPLLLNNITGDSLDNSGLILSQTELLRLDLNGIENQNIMMETENLNLNVDNIINDNVKQLDHFNFELNEPESEQLICDICLKGFTKLKALIQHIEQYTGKFLCQDCNTVFARKENLNYHSCNIFYKIKCPLCEKIFSQKKFLTLHMRSVHDKEFTCQLCAKSYDSKQALNTHVCSKVPVHKKEKFPCNVCPKVFYNKKNLYGHLARHRTKSKEQITCEVCNTTLSSRPSYLKHVKVHEGSFFPCDVCNKVFSRQDTLREHKTQLHATEEKVVTCEICQKTTKSWKLMQKHLQTHNTYKPHKCDTCQASFKQRTNLTKHKNGHKCLQSRLDALFKDDVVIYSCPKCDKNMKLKSSLLRHMRTVHPDCEISSDIMKPTLGKLTKRKPDTSTTGEDESVMDLKETIENMNYNTDEVNNCTEINIEIDKIINNTDNIDNFLNDSSDRIVENLISIAAKENELTGTQNEYTSKEVCLSMPDLTADQEIKLGENAYILDNGTIVEPQESSSKVVVYILDQDKFT